MIFVVNGIKGGTAGDRWIDGLTSTRKFDARVSLRHTFHSHDSYTIAVYVTRRHHCIGLVIQDFVNSTEEAAAGQLSAR